MPCIRYLAHTRSTHRRPEEQVISVRLLAEFLFRRFLPSLNRYVHLSLFTHQPHENPCEDLPSPSILLFAIPRPLKIFKPSRAMPVALFPRRHSQSHYTPLSTHESQTPSTFFGAKPVLHAHCPRCDVLIRKTDGEGASFEVRQWWRSGVSTEEGSQVDGVNGDAPAEFETVRKVEALVGSE